MMFCCNLFQSAVQDAGKKGISIIAHNEEGFKFFCLQARACDSDQEKNLSESLPHNVHPRFLRIVEQVAVKFCPFCGCKLERTIKGDQDAFDLLAKHHENFLLR